MNFSQSDKVEKLSRKLKVFMERFIKPAHEEYERAHRQGEFPLALIQNLKEQAKKEELWNLFLPSLPDDQPGTRLTNFEYAKLAEIMGRYYWCSEVFNCNPPDTGNMELLHLFATGEQRKDWLEPLFSGEIRSVFSMTEPDVASSDATNIATRIERHGDEYVINGKKWFSSAASHPLARFTIVMGLTDTSESTPVHRRQSMIIVPLNTPGVTIVKEQTILNYRMGDGICEIHFDNVRVPADNLLGSEGDGFKLAQARLGPGRVHHCMRAIGMAEYALELMCQRAVSRRAFGKSLSDFSNNQDLIARSRVEIDQARLLTLNCAWKIDTEGNRAAATDVSAIKYVCALLLQNVADRALQIHGAAGLTNETPLAFIYTWGRAMRFLDGPDEVHLRTVARAELKPYR